MQLILIGQFLKQQQEIPTDLRISTTDFGRCCKGKLQMSALHDCLNANLCCSLCSGLITSHAVCKVQTTHPYTHTRHNTLPYVTDAICTQMQHSRKLGPLVTFIRTQANRNSAKQGNTENSPFSRLRPCTKSMGLRFGDWVEQGQDTEARGRA